LFSHPISIIFAYIKEFMETNAELELAWRCIERTGTHLFLTGKAGTGKTTFLKQLKERSPKRMVVLAPTGIAAINAGGVTIHSFFQLPFAPYIPGTEFSSNKLFKFGKEKINIIRSLDLLVIDEISMVRADLLDLIDHILRRYRDKTKPFGGVQLLMIGDLQQLAPVVKDEERRLLEEYYDSIFFFDSKALQQTSYISIELKRVFRQSEAHFLHLLNQIRENTANNETLVALNQRYIPNFEAKEGEEYIRLTTHNAQAQEINDKYLAKIKAPSYSFRSTVTGNFPQSSYPADEILTLKEGSQIMFVKNDSSFDKKFYNGKIGRIIRMTEDEIEVQGQGDLSSFVLQKEVWTNSKYVLNKETKEISEEVEGTFEQYPVRLAWAITIHKSQGLTFERAIIDIGGSFAHGQTYVALSRCKTLDGIVLSSPITQKAIISNMQVTDFVKEAENLAPNESVMTELERAYYLQLLSEQFDFQPIRNTFARTIEQFEESAGKLYPHLFEQCKISFDVFSAKIISVSDNFKNVFTHLFKENPNYKENSTLQERISSGATYFSDCLIEILLPLVSSLKVEIDNKEGQKRMNELIESLTTALRIKLSTLQHIPTDGFSVEAYQKAKSEASILQQEEHKETSKKKLFKEKSVVSDDIVHQELYEHLRAWRNAEATERLLPAYAILHQKALHGIANLLPSTSNDLLKIPHLGKKTVEKYGATILDIVGEFTPKR